MTTCARAADSAAAHSESFAAASCSALSAVSGSSRGAQAATAALGGCRRPRDGSAGDFLFPGPGSADSAVPASSGASADGRRYRADMELETRAGVTVTPPAGK